MANLFLSPTDKPSRLHLWIDDKGSRLELCELEYSHTRNAQNIYITSDEEIKRIDYWLNIDNNTISNGEMFELANDAPSCKKIILTTDQDLIKDGVQTINDEFLEWFVKNPSCEEVEVKHKEVIQYGNMTMYDHNGDGSHYFCKDCEVETSRSKEELLKFGVEYYKIIIPKEEQTKCYCGHTTYCDCGLEEPKQETLEEAAAKYSKYNLTKEALEFAKTICYCFKETKQDDLVEESILTGIQWQKERSYSEEEVKNMINDYDASQILFNEKYTYNEWFEQFKKK